MIRLSCVSKSHMALPVTYTLLYYCLFLYNMIQYHAVYDIMQSMIYKSMIEDLCFKTLFSW